MRSSYTKEPQSGFAQHIQVLQPEKLDGHGLEALSSLYISGFDVTAGVLAMDADGIRDIAQQPSVQEFCPNDAQKRFGSKAMMESWLTKNGGRYMFILRAAGVVAGYGWTGAESCPELPNCDTTFAVRLSENAGVTGRGLGALFTRVIVSGSMALYGPQNIGLETWASNTAAVRSYIKAGATLVTTKEDMRPTLHPLPLETDGQRRDTRLFMQFERSNTPAAYH